MRLSGPHIGQMSCAGSFVRFSVVPGFEIVNPDVIGHAAAIMFPGAELAEDAVERHLRIVGRERDETAARDGQLLWQFRIQPDGLEIADKRVEGGAAGTEDDQSAGCSASP